MFHQKKEKKLHVPFLYVSVPGTFHSMVYSLQSRGAASAAARLLFSLQWESTLMFIKKGVLMVLQHLLPLRKLAWSFIIHPIWMMIYKWKIVSMSLSPFLLFGDLIGSSIIHHIGSRNVVLRILSPLLHNTSIEHLGNIIIPMAWHQWVSEATVPILVQPAAAFLLPW